jgi:hypothetical protein
MVLAMVISKEPKKKTSLLGELRTPLILLANVAQHKAGAQKCQGAQNSLAMVIWEQKKPRSSKLPGDGNFKGSKNQEVGLLGSSLTMGFFYKK